MRPDRPQLPGDPGGRSNRSSGPAATDLVAGGICRDAILIWPGECPSAHIGVRMVDTRTTTHASWSSKRIAVVDTRPEDPHDGPVQENLRPLDRNDP